ncbi:MAG: hypothetical protein ABI551_11420 [Polyangiaceae bacterium]
MPPETSITPPLAGWVPYSDYDSRRDLWVPGSAAANPAPIAWEACDGSLRPTGIDCRQMKTDWPAPTTGGSPGGALQGDVEADGTVELLVERASGTAITNLVAAADGPVHFAVYQPSSRPCTVLPQDITKTKFAYLVLDDFAGGSVSEKGGGAIAGDFVDGQRRILHFAEDATAKPHQLSVGPDGIVDVPIPPTVDLYSWTSTGAVPDSTIWGPVQEPGWQIVFAKPAGSSLFFETESGPLSKIKVGAMRAAVHDLISNAGDPTPSSAGLGTDGKDMGWVEGSGALDGGIYPTVALYTAPYTESATTLAASKRRVRSASGAALGGTQTIVSCGYAVHTNGGGLSLVRLSDGVSWQLPADSIATQWNWQTPVALTCSELFAAVNIPLPKPHLGLVRVELASLGSGIPAD